MRNRAVTWVLAGAAAATLIAVGAVLALRSEPDHVVAEPASKSGVPSTAAPSTTAEAGTTSPDGTAGDSTGDTAAPVRHESLAAGSRQVANVRPDVARLQVLAAPPPGWDVSLSPVVAPMDPIPPRSGQDIGREPIPSPAIPVNGRETAPHGRTLANPSTYQPPQPLVLGVVERQGEWVQVQVPVRPNGTAGWVRLADVELTTTTRSIVVSLSQRTLRVVDGAQVLMDVPAAIGRAATPTPTGTFTVTDLVPSTDPAGPYGPVALALDGHSEALDAFPSDNAGDAPDAVAPVLAIHGTNRPASIGQAASNGCPRLLNDQILELARLAPAGTPVHIWP
ncbi:MAG: L,D-transpeptidase [Microthrixaceae bacterium]